MSEIETFFRRCPNCGRRFEVRLIGKKLVSAETINESRPVSADYFAPGSPISYLEVGETEPTIIDVEKFQYAYRCKHCGHQWVEIRDKDFKVE
jgi:DNA-directed RNA polymerase subunit RPC12/RpoP